VLFYLNEKVISLEDKKFSFNVISSRIYPSPKLISRALLTGLPNSKSIRRYKGKRDIAGMFTPDNYHFLNSALRCNRNFLYADHGYFHRGRFFRLTFNDYQHSTLGASDGKRWKNLGIEIKSWKKNGTKILLAPQSDQFFRIHGTSQGQWIRETTDKLRSYTDREIIVTRKVASNAEDNFRASLDDVFAVVVFTSVAGLYATVEGVPCFATQDCASAKFGDMKLENVESPTYVENRLEKLSVLADNQWTLEEISNGSAWKSIYSQIQHLTLEQE
jgi:hypothetical protein